MFWTDHGEIPKDHLSRVKQQNPNHLERLFDQIKKRHYFEGQRGRGIAKTKKQRTGGREEKSYESWAEVRGVKAKGRTILAEQQESFKSGW